MTPKTNVTVGAPTKRIRSLQGQDLRIVRAYELTLLYEHIRSSKEPKHARMRGDINRGDLLKFAQGFADRIDQVVGAGDDAKMAGVRKEWLEPGPKFSKRLQDMRRWQKEETRTAKLDKTKSSGVAEVVMPGPLPELLSESEEQGLQGTNSEPQSPEPLCVSSVTKVPLAMWFSDEASGSCASSSSINSSVDKLRSTTKYQQPSRTSNEVRAARWDDREKPHCETRANPRNASKDSEGIQAAQAGSNASQEKLCPTEEDLMDRFITWYFARRERIGKRFVGSSHDHAGGRA